MDIKILQKEHSMWPGTSVFCRLYDHGKDHLKGQGHSNECNCKLLPTLTNVLKVQIQWLLCWGIPKNLDNNIKSNGDVLHSLFFLLDYALAEIRYIYKSINWSALIETSRLQK